MKSGKKVTIYEWMLKIICWQDSSFFVLLGKFDADQTLFICFVSRGNQSVEIIEPEQQVDSVVHNLVNKMILAV